MKAAFKAQSAEMEINRFFEVRCEVTGKDQLAPFTSNFVKFDFRTPTIVSPTMEDRSENQDKMDVAVYLKDERPGLTGYEVLFMDGEGTARFQGSVFSGNEGEVAPRIADHYREMLWEAYGD